jgi:HEAT repeat protein
MRWILPLLLPLVATTSTATAYVDCALSLGRIAGTASTIAVLRVEQTSLEKQAILFKSVRALKGNEIGADVKQLIRRGFHPREPRLVLGLAAPGQTAVAFVQGRVMLVCLGAYWYECALREGAWWEMTCGRPDLAMAYQGPAQRLAQATAAILAGREVIVPAVRYDAGPEYRRLTDFQNTLRGNACPLCRVRASLKLDGLISELSRRPGYVVGRGAGSAEDVPALLAQLKAPDAPGRAEAAQMLALLDLDDLRSACPALVAALNDAAPLVRVRAAAALSRSPESRPAAVAALIAAVRESPSARREAIDALGDMGADARDAVAVVAQRLSDADPRVRWAGAEALGRMGAVSAPAVPALQAALADPAVRLAAADALGWLGRAAEPAVPALTALTRDADAEPRRVAAWSLLRIGKGGAAAVPVLLDELRNGDWRIRRDAAVFLWGLGEEARPALPALDEALSDANAHVRWAAAGAVVGLRGPKAKAAVPAVLRALKDPDNVLTRRYAPALLVQIGENAAPEARRALTEALHDTDADVRRCAAIALAQLDAGAIEPRSREHLARVIEALRASQLPYVRQQAVMALGRMGPAARESAAALSAALRDEDRDVRQGATWALSQIKARR